MNPIQRLRNWTMRLPSVWGLGQAEIHSSLFIMLGMLSLLITIVSLSRTGFGELLPAAVTLPVVWVMSLAVRVAAQQLALGDQALDVETIVGPSGNLTTDYEYLPAKRILFYSLAGQLATIGLVLLGFIVSAAMTQVQSTEATAAQILDLKGGWQSDAWASQIMWVNLFLAILHLLPTLPFDMRALIFALFSLGNRNAQEPLVFRRVAILVSHLATFMLGVGLTLLAFAWIFQREIVGWYAAVAAAVYLFVAGQWESARADELEEQYSPVPARRDRRHSRQHKRPHLKFGLGEAQRSRDKVVSQSGRSAEEGRSGEFAEMNSSELADVDEILRKLHREGRESLSLREQEALLSASRELKEKRGQTS